MANDFSILELFEYKPTDLFSSNFFTESTSLIRIGYSTNSVVLFIHISRKMVRVFMTTNFFKSLKIAIFFKMNLIPFTLAKFANDFKIKSNPKAYGTILKVNFSYLFNLLSFIFDVGLFSIRFSLFFVFIFIHDFSSISIPHNNFNGFFYCCRCCSFFYCINYVRQKEKVVKKPKDKNICIRYAKIQTKPSITIEQSINQFYKYNILIYFCFSFLLLI